MTRRADNPAKDRGKDMKETVRRLLLEAAAGVNPGDAVQAIWPGPAAAWPDLAEAFAEESLAADDESVLDVLRAAMYALGRPLMGKLCRWFPQAERPVQANLALTLAVLAGNAVGAVPLLAAALGDGSDAEERSSLRNAAAYALGTIGGAIDEEEAEGAMADAVAVLARVVGDPAESQPLRSYCVEALMDVGPPARASIPVLERMLRDEAEDDDLRHFAWAALKSVATRSREHPCGGTWAEHMRSLGRGVRQSELDAGERERGTQGNES